MYGTLHFGAAHYSVDVMLDHMPHVCLAPRMRIRPWQDKKGLGL